MNRSLLPLLLVSVFLVSCSSDEVVEERQWTPPPPTEAPEPKVGGVYTTASGLQYEVLRTGSGKKPSRTDQVKVHYHGYLPGGEVFDSSVNRGQPAVFGLDKVIPGWTEGVQLMREGSKFRFKVPSQLAYGQRGSPPRIGPNQTLLFEIELFEVVAP
ncbi:MAG: FKBP-type peptidyl-prolyl cis-trans isomerase [Verrucomicrobiota bacterium]